VLSSSSITLASPHHHSCPEVLLEDLQEVAIPLPPSAQEFRTPSHHNFTPWQQTQNFP